jgi:hypothetical protein
VSRLKRVRHRIAQVEWDDVNLEKLETHAVLPEEVEEVFAFRPMLLRHPRWPDRFVALGIAGEDGRLLFVPYEYDARRRAVRQVTAYPPEHERWKLLYKVT